MIYIYIEYNKSIIKLSVQRSNNLVLLFYHVKWRKAFGVGWLTSFEDFEARVFEKLKAKNFIRYIKLLTSLMYSAAYKALTINDGITKNNPYGTMFKNFINSAMQIGFDQF